MRPPIEHAYSLDGDRYLLREATMLDGQQRIEQYYALSLTLTPGTLHPDTGQPLFVTATQGEAYARTLTYNYGNTLYAKAVTRECLVDAPDFWWTTQPVTTGQNGAPVRVLTFQGVSADLWSAHLREVNTFLEAIFRAQNEKPAPAPSGRPDDTAVVARAETIPPVFRGRAE